jgi:hypothetical protein
MKVTLSKEDDEWLVSTAREMGLSVSAFIRLCIKFTYEEGRRCGVQLPRCSFVR